MKALASFLVASSIALPVSAQVDCNQDLEALQTGGDVPMTVAEFVTSVTTREQVFAKAASGYGYTVDVSVQTLQGNVVDGEFRQVSTVDFDAAGERRLTASKTPMNTLVRLKLSERDIAVLNDIRPFALTSDELADRDIVYAGRQKLDGASALVFDIATRTPQASVRGFQGLAWVLDGEQAIVRTCGTVGGFPIASMRVIVDRVQVAGGMWFPAMQSGDEDVQVDGNVVRVRLTVKFSDYKPRP